VNNPASYVVGDGSPYPTTSEGIFFDAPLSLTSDATNAVNTSGSVYAYNLLAPKPVVGQRYFPHVVIKITDVEAKADGDKTQYENATWWLTIKDVYDTRETSNPTETDYLSFEGGKVYQVANVPFSLGQLSPTPEPGDRQVTVSVTVKEWIPVPVAPVL
jgi:hypothetical protein